MKASALPAGLCERFSVLGSTAQITNMSSPIAAEEDKFLYEGEVEQLTVEGETFVVQFRWLAEKDPETGVWTLLTDPSLLRCEMSLELVVNARAVDDGRFLFLPAEPIVHEQLLLIAHDYVGPTDRVPLKRENVLPAP